MGLKEVLSDDRAVFECPECGKDFELEYVEIEDAYFSTILRKIYANAICADCENLKELETRNAEAAKRKFELENSLDERMSRTGIPENFQAMDKPFIRHTAEWIYRHREQSLIIGGDTGTGKTSSCAFVVRLMLKQRFMTVRYCSRQTLFAEHVRSKTTDGDCEANFLARLDKIDLLIIDEMIGKKGVSKLSDSAQELFFNLIDGVYSQGRKTRVWILGNFVKNSIEKLVVDPEPTLRRISESFQCAWINENSVDESGSFLWLNNGKIKRKTGGGTSNSRI